MDDDAGRALGRSGEGDGVGQLVEADDHADARPGVEAGGDDGVETSAGIAVTRLPTRKRSEQAGPWATTSPTNSWPITTSRSASQTNTLGASGPDGWSM
jgi:hypothetical protein